MGLFSGITDAIFGSDDEVSTETRSTLTPQQQQALQKVLAELQEGPAQFAGKIAPDLSGLESTSLAALEQEALDRSAGATETNKAANLALIDILKSKATNIDDFFTKTVQDPAIEAFREDIIPGIRDDFGGQFFGGERREAEARAHEDLLTGLTRSRADISFNRRGEDLDRQLKAAGIAGDVSGANTGELLKLLDAGSVPREVEGNKLLGEFEVFLQNQGIKKDRIKNILTALGLNASENITTVSEGGGGLLGGAVSGLISGGIGSFGG